ncbi:hypothetical protein MFIFM68171_06279 [Madurella fahalii]|uniref:Uncharacterized protein n=1 Tax=Madurella fahalii TaxID=1157608 RepID=A0ABQ0GE97_9PEZI
MARDRLPGRFAIALAVFHSLSLIACFASIVAAAISANQNKKAAVVTIGAFVAAFWTIGEDVAEIAALADTQRKCVRRCPAQWLYLLELVTAIFCFALPAASMLAYEEARYQRCRYVPHRDEEKFDCKSSSGPMDTPWMASLGAIYLAATIHSILFVMNTALYCIKRRKARSVAQEEKA